MNGKTSQMFAQTPADLAMTAIARSSVVQRVVRRFLERRAAGIDFNHPVVEDCDLEQAESEGARRVLEEMHCLDVLRHVAALFAN